MAVALTTAGFGCCISNGLACRLGCCFAAASTLAVVATSVAALAFASPTATTTALLGACVAALRVTLAAVFCRRFDHGLTSDVVAASTTALRAALVAV